MKKLLLIVLASTMFTGCGMSETLTRGCSGDMDMLCDMMFGQDPEKIDELDERVTENENAIESLRSRLLNVLSDVDLIETFIDTLSSDTETDLTALEDRLEDLEDEAVDLASDIADLDTDTRIVELIDPCGDDPGRFDEVLLVTANGSIIAYFRENGSRQYLTVLEDGNYQTTDRQRCNFSVVAGEYTE
jgi:hypothetical protein